MSVHIILCYGSYLGLYKKNIFNLSITRFTKYSLEPNIAWYEISGGDGGLVDSIVSDKICVREKVSGFVGSERRRIRILLFLYRSIKVGQRQNPTASNQDTSETDRVCRVRKASNPDNFIPVQMRQSRILTNRDQTSVRI